MKFLSNVFSKLLIICSFITSAIYANPEIKNQETTEENVYVEIAVDEQTEEEQKAILAHRKEEKIDEEGKGGAQISNAAFYSTSHPGAFHNPVYVSTFMKTIELEDGSMWKIAYYDSYKTHAWYKSDAICITTNLTYSYPTYGFQFVNQNTGDTVDVNLIRGPLLNGFFTHKIVGFDDFNHLVYLEDGSQWNISGYDIAITKYWLLNDTIIIGVNTLKDAPFSPNILINVRKLNYACAASTN